MDFLELINYLKKKIKESLLKYKKKLDLNFEIPEICLEIPTQKVHGDLSTNISMVCAKIFKISPIKIAEIIINDLNKMKCFDKIEIAGSGFVNFFVNNEFLNKTLLKIDKENNSQVLNFGENKKVLVEFVSSNPTGPMHIGNARLGALGDTLAKALNVAGFKVCKEFYVNDAGNQIEKFADSLVARYLQIFNPLVEFPEDGYHGDDIKILARKFADIHGNLFISNKKESLRESILKFALPLNIEKIKKNLEDYRVFFDNWFHESSLYSSGEIEKILNKFKNSNYTYLSNDALWFKATEFGADKDEVLVRKNGIPTYFAADIAYHVNKFLTRNYDICVNFLGADHHGHVSRMRAAMRFFGIEDSRLVFIIVQLVHLVKNGKIVSMSKRSGQSETLEDFMKVVNVNCARFMFTMQDANSTMDFDIDLANKNDNTNPSYYVQYAYARANSILESFAKNYNFENADLSLLVSEHEKNLIFVMSMFSYEIREVAKSMDPTKVAKYAIKLASCFHKFYNSNKVNCANENLFCARYFLCLQFCKVMKKVLEIMKIDAPKSM